jgi:hypothetical protein
MDQTTPKVTRNPDGGLTLWLPQADPPCLETVSPEEARGFVLAKRGAGFAITRRHAGQSAGEDADIARFDDRAAAMSALALIAEALSSAPESDLPAARPAATGKAPGGRRSPDRAKVTMVASFLVAIAALAAGVTALFMHRAAGMPPGAQPVTGVRMDDNRIYPLHMLLTDPGLLKQPEQSDEPAPRILLPREPDSFGLEPLDPEYNARSE